MTDEGAKAPSPRLLAARLGIGLAQGFALYAVDHWSKELPAVWLGTLMALAVLTPVVALGSLGVLRRRALLAWLAAALLISAGLGGYAAFVAGSRVAGHYDDYIPAILFTGAALFILHHLIVPADAERRWRASYERYFDEGWKDAVRLAFAGLFVGALWLLLHLGASLFELIGLKFLRTLIQKPWFAFPASATFFALAVHLTDVRTGLIQGARTLLLTLLSWLLTVITVIAVGFLAALPFTGLKALSAAGSASGTMLAVCAALVILINASYLEGERKGYPPSVLRWFVRAASLALPPLVAIAIYGLAVRIGQYGLSPQRIRVAACLLVAACYAVGYAWAAIMRGPWMKRLEGTNWLTAQVAVATLLLLLSPIVDPVRISVNDQVARLDAGRTSAEKFDYRFLRFQAGRWGTEALKSLAGRTQGDRAPAIAKLAQDALTSKNRWDAPPTSVARRTGAIHAVGAPLPEGFLSQAWDRTEDPAVDCLDPRGDCQAVIADIDGVPGPDVIVLGPGRSRVFGFRANRWVEVGSLSGVRCSGDTEAIGRGDYRISPPVMRSGLDVNGRRFLFEEARKCPAKAGKSAAVDDDVTDVAIVKPVR